MENNQYFHLPRSGQPLPLLPQIPSLTSNEQLPNLPHPPSQSHLESSFATTVPSTTSAPIQDPTKTSTTNTNRTTQYLELLLNLNRPPLTNPFPLPTVQQIIPPTQYQPYYENNYQRLAYPYQDTAPQNHDKQLASLKDKDVKHQATIQSLKQSNKLKEKEIQKLKTEVEYLKSGSSNFSSALLKSLVTKNKQLGEDNEELRQQNDKLKNVEKELTDLKSDHNLLTQKVETLNEKLSDKITNDPLVQATYKVIQEIESKFIDEKAELEAKLEGHKVEVERLEMSINCPENGYKVLLQNLETNYNKAASKINSLLSELESFSNEISELTSKKDGLEDQIRSLELRKPAQHFNIEDQSYNKKLDALEMEKQSLEEKVKRLECDNEDLIKGRYSVKSSSGKVSKQIDILHREIRDLSKKMKKYKKARKEGKPKQIIIIRNQKNVSTLAEEFNHTRIQLQNASQNHDKDTIKDDLPVADEENVDTHYNDGENSSTKKIRLDEGKIPVNLNFTK
ncbi:unnamed protein product [Orchesella dallaii]|uniref:Uncharacterized protein n=1 Tax=Orchesella dallaii TaxID=48710 RepID=A0ABP1RHY4_9HEXA